MRYLTKIIILVLLVTIEILYKSNIFITVTIIVINHRTVTVNNRSNITVMTSLSLTFDGMKISYKCIMR